MLGNLIKTQILENIYGVKFIVTFVICVLLVIGATVTGIGRYESQMDEEQKIISINRGNLEDTSSWHQVGRSGIKIIKPATRLSIFASGLEQSVGRTATVREGDFPHMEDSIYSTAPIFAVFGDLDLTFIIKIVISLFAILFTYDLVSGEKERGTLKLCLSNPVPRNTFILGRSIGSFVSLLIPLLLPLIIGLLAIMLLGNITFGGEEWARLGVIVLGYVLYMLAFFSLGIFISAITKRSAISFLILLFLWVMFVLVVPKAAMMTAGQIHPIPGINEVRAEQFQLQRDFWQRTWDLTREEFQRSGGPRLERRERWMMMRQIRDAVRQELEPEYNRQNENLVASFKQQQANLTNLAMTISRVSPASAVTYIGMNLSGTGFDEQENFLRMLTDYRERFTQFLEEEEAREERTTGGPMSHASEQGQLDFSLLPEFRYERLSVGESLALALPDLLMLTILSIIFYALGFVCFLRYDVR